MARILIHGNLVERRSSAACGALRRTTGRDDPAENLWVYGRGRRPCRRCGTPISARKHGVDAGLTYWCAACQRSPDRRSCLTNLTLVERRERA
jgi:formamidopyrimidine-DNA glycosylase